MGRGEEDGPAREAVKLLLEGETRLLLGMVLSLVLMTLTGGKGDLP